MVTKALRERGHEAYSCDLLPTEGNPDWHIQRNVLGIVNGLAHKSESGAWFLKTWDMLIGFPPCPYLCNSGVRWLIDNPERYAKMRDACDLFNGLLTAPIPKIAVENPIQHKYARQYIRKYDQIIQPYQFGDMESKATCLWLVGLPPLMAQYSGGEGIKQSTWRLPPSKDRGKERSRTFPGIAKAMAEQWG